MTQPRLLLENVSKSFDGNRVLKGIDLVVQPGDIVGLVGENGAGKSTCMNVVAGAFPPDEGRVLLDGIEITGATVADQLQRGVRMIRQELSLAPSLTVAENIFLGDYRAGGRGWVRRDRLNEAAQAILHRVRAAHIDPDAEVGTLRSGDQQLVEIAKALTIDPKLLIMDEPTSSLTAHEAEGLLALVRDLAATGTAIILITHRLEEVLSTCRRVVVFRDGTKVEERTTPVTRDDVLKAMIGRSLDHDRPTHAVQRGQVVLSARDLSDGTLGDVTFEAHAGEILGLFGLVGAGRTELLETIYGMRGRVRGELSLKPGARVHMVTESRKTSGIFPTHDVQANISVSALPLLSRWGFVRARREASEAARLKERFGIRARSLSLPITALSGGNQQKALLARAFLTGPGLLLLDEPTHGVDVGAKAEIYRLMREMADASIAIVVASSEIPELLAIADRCMVMSRQRLVGVVDRAEMTETQLLSLAFAGH